MENNMEIFLKKLKIELVYDPVSKLLVNYPKDTKKSQFENI